MAYLGDYLGQLLSEIAMARVQADLETIRLAELYASHALLRTLPVPHVRVPEVDMDIPVLIKTSEPPRAGESPRGGAALADLAKKFDELLMGHVGKAGVTLTPADRKKLRGGPGRRLAPSHARRRRQQSSGCRTQADPAARGIRRKTAGPYRPNICKPISSLPPDSGTTLS